MIYRWNVEGLFPVSADTAAAEFQRIYDKCGKLDPKDIVEESKNQKAPLHNCFEWNNEIAANRYREEQASSMIRLLKVETKTESGSPVEVRAYHSVESTYLPLPVILQRQDLTEEMMQNALRELKSFRAKYATLQSLHPIIEVIDNLISKEET